MTEDTQKRPRTAAEAIQRGDGRHAFGQSLFLNVRGGSALWEYCYRDGGKPKWAGLGPPSRAGRATFP